MRLQILHETICRYAEPARNVVMNLRMTPRNHDGQYVVDWRIDVSENCRLDRVEDAFGNFSHGIGVDGPVAELRIVAEGEIDLQDSHGVVRGSIERFPPSLYLRETVLTAGSPAMAALGERAGKAGAEPLEKLHELMQLLHDEMRLDEKAPRNRPAAEAFAAKCGLPRDFVHVFAAAARALNIPARCVSGYRYCPDGPDAQDGAHTWAEAYADGLGWVAFDPVHNFCPTDAYVRLAVALDFGSARPVRGSRDGPGDPTVAVAIRINRLDQSTGEAASEIAPPVQRQTQSQSQGANSVNAEPKTEG